MMFIPWANAAVLDVPGAYPTVADAIAVAASGDTIQLGEGRFAACVDTSGKSVEIVGSGDSVLDGGGCENAIVVQSGEGVALRDVSIENAGQRGIYVAYSTLTLDNVTVSGTGHSEAWGGALYAYQSIVTTTSCVFSANVGGYGGAIFFDAYNSWVDTGSTFDSNTATYNGGAVYSYWVSTLDLTDSTFSQNSTSGSGGALYTAWYYPLTIRDSSFSANTAVGNGGAIQIYALDDVVTIERTRFEGNTAGSYGGAIEAEWYADVRVADSVFADNTATYAGGGLFGYAEDNVAVSRSRFCRNSSPWGGAVAVQWTSVDSYTNNQLVGNTADYGAGLARYASYAGTITQNSFVDNAATTQGGASYASYGYALFRNNIVAGSEGMGVMAADAYSYAAYPPDYSGWSDNDPVDAGGYSWVDPELGNVWGDPQFVNVDGCDSDLHLVSASAFRDAGHPDTFDLDGSPADLGAYGGSGVAIEDADGDGFSTTTDCDDGNPDIWPDAIEVCDGVDNNCDGLIDGAVDGAGTWYADADGDGFGTGEGRIDCDAAEGEAAVDGDCDDADADTFPGASEIIADGVDQDCDGEDEPLEAPSAAEERDQPDETGCGCSTATVPAWAWVAGLLVVARRRRG